MNLQNMDLDDWRNLATIISSLFTAVAIVIGGTWFLYTRQYGRRAQFDIECSFFPIDDDYKNVIVEIRFILENKGLVEQDLHGLHVSVHGLSSLTDLCEDPATKELQFDKEFIRDVVVVQKKADVRPNVRHVFTHIVKLVSPGPLIRVTSGFYYDEKKEAINKVARVFRVIEKSEGVSHT